MKLITEIENYGNLPQYHVDGIIFSYINFATISNKTFTFPEIEKIVERAKALNKETILKVDKIMEEDDLDDLYKFLDNAMELGIDYYMFTDMSVLNYFKEKNEMNRLIYASKTMNCSYNDISYYQSQGIKVIPSNELTLEDLHEIVKLDNIVIDGYGYSSIFYSKRKLLTLFKEYIESEDDFTNQLFTIKEEKRENRYPIFENKNGTFIFTANKYVIYKELEELQNSFMFKVESLFVSEEVLFEILTIYNKAIKNGISEEDYQKLLSLDNNISTSFLYKKPSILDSGL
jgi:putative protease